MSDRATLPESELFRLLAEQSGEHAIIFTDAQGLIRSWNPVAEQIFGFKRHEILGKSVKLLFTAEEVERGTPDHEMAVATAHGLAEGDRWMAHRDGSRFWASGAMHALRDERGRVIGFGKILRNRTDLKEQLDTLRNQVEALNASAHSRDVFLATLSHELRNPLSPLSDATQVIRMIAGNTPEIDFPLKIMERQIVALERLVDDLMEFSRLGAGKVELKKERTAMVEVIHRAVESTWSAVRERRHQLDVLVPEGPIIVEADPMRLEQVFVNLINNAAKFTPDGGRIWVKGAVEGREAVVRIEDNGAGIPHEMLPRIFDLFTQADSAQETKVGLGIGLSVVKTLVTTHGGSVQVRSDGDGKGSEFTVRLPLAESTLDHPN